MEFHILKVKSPNSSEYGCQSAYKFIVHLIQEAYSGLIGSVVTKLPLIDQVSFQISQASSFDHYQKKESVWTDTKVTNKVIIIFVLFFIF